MESKQTILIVVVVIAIIGLIYFYSKKNSKSLMFNRRNAKGGLCPDTYGRMAPCSNPTAVKGGLCFDSRTGQYNTDCPSLKGGWCLLNGQYGPCTAIHKNK
jgi:hypothetical protein